MRTLQAIAEAGSFTAAARALGLQQSTVSQHIKRLEALCDRRLLDRDTHRVALTPDGEAVLEHARGILDAHDRMARFLTGAPLRGRLRFGACEDFVLSALPDVLAAFARRHPEVDLELAAGLSEDLYDRFDAGGLDVVFVKRRDGDRRGQAAWSEPIAWVGRADHRLDPDAPLPLLLYPPPSVTRAKATAALEASRRPWRIAFTSASLAGLSAAARAGIGIMPHSLRLIPPGLAPLPAEAGLPALPGIEFVVIGPGGAHRVADALITAILQWAASGRTSAR
uniref:Transcriptional regulator, LysR family n=1 Tax=Caulobacter sp. (strain K31) TaxID=366602 RepID=B0T6P1_CAUSK